MLNSTTYTSHGKDLIKAKSQISRKKWLKQLCCKADDLEYYTDLKKNKGNHICNYLQETSTTPNQGLY